MIDFIEQCCQAISEILSNFFSAIAGAITVAMSYFLPIKYIVHLLILFFVLDVAFGYWTARKLRGEKFSAKIIWNTTVPRMVLTLVLVLGTFMWDTVYNQEFFSTYKLVGWFISGLLLLSILQNGYKITKWDALPKLTNLLGDKIREQTSIEATENTKP